MALHLLHLFPLKLFEFCMVNAGKCTSPMDLIGIITIYIVHNMMEKPCLLLMHVIILLPDVSCWGKTLSSSRRFLVLALKLRS